MALTLHTIDLEHDRESLLELLERNLPGLPHARRFSWLYRDNPAGQAWSWAVRETKTQELVGITSLFPRMIWINGQLDRCGQVGDFAINASYRSLGPAIMLQRATFQPVDQALIRFCYDCPPHDQGMAPLRRLGLRVSCRVEKYAKLQRSRREIEKRLGKGKVARSAAAVIDLFLSRRKGHRDQSRGIEINQMEGPFDDEFTRLDEQVKNSFGLRSRRDASTLNWRFLHDPLNTYRVLTARYRRELVGYVGIAIRGEDAYIVDLFTLDMNEVAEELLRAAIDAIKGDPIQALYVLIGEHSAIAPLLRHSGFHPRAPVANVVIYRRADTTVDSIPGEERGWYFAHVDLQA